jgi:hypothetical protein
MSSEKDGIQPFVHPRELLGCVYESFFYQLCLLNVSSCNLLLSFNEMFLTMNVNCTVLQSPYFCKTFSAKFTLQRLFVFVNRPDVFSQASFIN